MGRPERGSTLTRSLGLAEPEEETVLRALGGKKLGVREQFLDLEATARWLNEHDWDEAHVKAYLCAVDDHVAYVIRGDGWRLLSPDFGPDGVQFVLVTPAEEDL